MVFYFKKFKNKRYFNSEMSYLSISITLYFQTVGLWSNLFLVYLHNFLLEKFYTQLILGVAIVGINDWIFFFKKLFVSGTYGK